MKISRKANKEFVLETQVKNAICHKIWYYSSDGNNDKNVVKEE